MAASLEQIAFESKIKKIPQKLLRILKADIREDIYDIINEPIKCGGDCGELIKKNNNGKKIFYFKPTRDFYLGRACLYLGVSNHRNKSKDYEVSLKEMIKEAKEISYEEMRELRKNKFKYRG